MTRAAAIGECMIELSRLDSDRYQQVFAGDVYNTAVYLRRLSQPDVVVDFITATGDDALSDQLLAASRTEGLIPVVTRIAGASPALYIISTDDQGERSFTYYRDASPVKQLFGDGEEAVDLRGYDLIYLSAITLQLLTPAARGYLRSALSDARDRGCLVAFDSNYRPGGWPGADVARSAVDDISPLVDIALVSLADERSLRGIRDATEIIDVYRAAGVAEIIVKDGSNPVTAYHRGRFDRLPVSAATYVEDTTGAGDSFNGAYLAERLRGIPLEAAVRTASRIAAEVVGVRGALIPASHMDRRRSESGYETQQSNRVGVDSGRPQALWCDQPG